MKTAPKPGAGRAAREVLSEAFWAQGFALAAQGFAFGAHPFCAWASGTANAVPTMAAVRTARR